MIISALGSVLILVLGKQNTVSKRVLQYSTGIKSRTAHLVVPVPGKHLPVDPPSHVPPVKMGIKEDLPHRLYEN